MVDTTVCNWDFYKIPTIEILQYRTAFYSLRRRHDQSIEQWLKRVRELIDFCKFPLFFKYLLMDRFICGLDIVELNMIQSAGKFSTLEELLENLSQQKKQPNINLTDGNSGKSKNKSSLDLSEKECSQNKPPIENPDEDENYLIEFIPVEVDEDEDEDYPLEEGTTLSVTEETNNCSVLGEEYIDSEMLNDAMQFECEDYKYSIDDAAPVLTTTSVVGAVMDANTVTNDTVSDDEIDNESLTDNSSESEDPDNEIEQNDSNSVKANGKPYACDRCDKSFVHSSSLAKHKRIIHQGIRPFPCDKCNKRFISAIDLRRHSVTHTGEKLFVCDQCDKSFTQASQLVAHKKLIHEGIPKIPRYACKICDKKFFSSSYLKQHLNTHTGERPYACDQCDRKFTHSATLDRHIKTVHQEIRPYACHLCLMSFKMSKGLKAHLLKHKQANLNMEAKK